MKRPSFYVRSRTVFGARTENEPKRPKHAATANAPAVVSVTFQGTNSRRRSVSYRTSVTSAAFVPPCNSTARNTFIYFRFTYTYLNTTNTPRSVGIGKDARVTTRAVRSDVARIRKQ